MFDDDEGYFLDDGTPVNPNLIPKPGLCVTCVNDDKPSEEVLCNLNRIDQHGQGEFKCYGYVKKVFNISRGNS
jgi:hypothetical protein